MKATYVMFKSGAAQFNQHYPLPFHQAFRQRFLKLSSATAACLLVFISGCSGDGRPFSEEVEANNRQLKTLTIQQPAGLLEDLVISPGTQHTFSFTATDQSDLAITLPTTNRRWVVDDPSIASIDKNGNLSAIAEGETFVTVSVGTIESGSFPISVRDEALSSIEQIRGDESMERCIPQLYQAVGRFVGATDFPQGSLRGLPNAQWSVASAEVGAVAEPVDGFASAFGVDVGGLALTASVDDISFTQTITIEDTLQEILIEPDTAAVQLGRTLQLNALGRYNNEGVLRNVDITDEVQWSAEDDNDVLNVGNTSINKGVVTPSIIGNEPVAAACGDLTGQKTVVVIERNATAAPGLSFSDDGPLVLSLASGPRQLELSTGTDFDSDLAITTDDDTEWTVQSGTNVVTFADTSPKGTVTPLAVGTATIRATYQGRFADLEIQVLP